MDPRNIEENNFSEVFSGLPKLSTQIILTLYYFILTLYYTKIS